MLTAHILLAIAALGVVAVLVEALVVKITLWLERRDKLDSARE